MCVTNNKEEKMTNINPIKFGVTGSYLPKIEFMVSDLHYAEISFCSWRFRLQGYRYPIIRYVYFIRDGDVQRAFWGYEINPLKCAIDNSKIP